jgi:hypothetical protein
MTGLPKAAYPGTSLWFRGKNRQHFDPPRGLIFSTTLSAAFRLLMPCSRISRCVGFILRPHYGEHKIKAGWLGTKKLYLFGENPIS